MKADVNISLSLLKMYINTFWLTAIIGIKISAPGEARTHGLQIMRLTRCLLRYGGGVESTNRLSHPLISASQIVNKKFCTHGGTRTPNLRFRRPTPYPLGHAGTVIQTDFELEHIDGKSNIDHQKCASPGNRTRVARMGILHDTTTPATLYVGLLPNNVFIHIPLLWIFGAFFLLCYISLWPGFDTKEYTQPG